MHIPFQTPPATQSLTLCLWGWEHMTKWMLFIRRGKEKHCWACVTFPPMDNTWCHSCSLRKLYINSASYRNKDAKTHLSTPLESHKLQRMDCGRKEERKKNTKAINQTHLPSLHCFSPFPSLLVFLSSEDSNPDSIFRKIL